MCDWSTACSSSAWWLVVWHRAHLLIKRSLRGNTMSSLLEDLRFGLRMLAKNPGVHGGGGDHAGYRDQREHYRLHLD